MELLGQYVRERSDAAFAELTRRHVNLVYSAALRQIEGDPHTAEDVVQMVFAELARQAHRLAGHPTLTGWLYMTTRRVAGHVRRGRQRRERREQEACAMQNENRSSEPDDWRPLREVLDESMHELSEADRLALLVRFFEGRELRRVGEVLGLSENAARMRVQRALEKLRDILTRKGVATSAAGLATLLTANTITAAPAALLASAAAASALGVGGIAKLGGLAAAKTMILAMKTQLSYASILILAGAPLVIQHFEIQNARAELAGMRADTASLDFLRQRAAEAEANRLAAEELAMLRRDEAELARRQQEARTIEAATGGARKADWAKAERALRAAQADHEEVVAELQADALRTRTVNHMKQIGLAARLFASDNGDKLPRNFEDMKGMLGMAPDAANTLERFEFYPQPRAITESEPQLFLFREKEPRQIPGGKWERSYTLVDGSVQNAVSDTADFTAWEQQAQGIASAEAPTRGLPSVPAKRQ